MVEDALRAAYREAIGVTKTTEGNASVMHGVVVDKATNRFMATYCLGPNNGSLCKIFATRADADYWFDSMESLMNKGRLKNNLAVLRKAEATRKATAAAIDAILKENITIEPETSSHFAKPMSEGKNAFSEIFTPVEPKKDPKFAMKKATVRLFKLSLEQICEIASEEIFDGYILGSHNRTLGWRSTVCILVKDGGFTSEDVEEFLMQSGLKKIGLLSATGDNKVVNARCHVSRFF